jgi:hypothetical protein
MQVIIYKQDNDSLAVVYPTQEAIDIYGIEAIALKDVPSGKPFKIIDSSELPADRSARTFWTVDDVVLTDGVGAEYSTFPEPVEEPTEPLNEEVVPTPLPAEEIAPTQDTEPSNPIVEGEQP